MIYDILEEIAAVHGVTVMDITGNSRLQHIVRARQAAMWVLRQVTNMSEEAVARACGRVDHTTVRNAIQRVEDRMGIDDAYAAKLHEIRDVHRPARQSSQRYPGSPDRWAVWNVRMRGTAYTDAA